MSKRVLVITLPYFWPQFQMSSASYDVDLNHLCVEESTVQEDRPRWSRVLSTARVDIAGCLDEHPALRLTEDLTAIAVIAMCP